MRPWSVCLTSGLSLCSYLSLSKPKRAQFRVRVGSSHVGSVQNNTHSANHWFYCRYYLRYETKVSHSEMLRPVSSSQIGRPDKLTGLSGIGLMSRIFKDAYGSLCSLHPGSRVLDKSHVQFHIIYFFTTEASTTPELYRFEFNLTTSKNRFVRDLSSSVSKEIW